MEHTRHGATLYFKPAAVERQCMGRPPTCRMRWLRDGAEGPLGALGR